MPNITVSKDFDFRFPSTIPLALSATTRSTKEVAILLSVSSFRSAADFHDYPGTTPQSATPASAATTVTADHDKAISLLKERERLRDKLDRGHKSPPIVSIPIQRT